MLKKSLSALALAGALIAMPMAANAAESYTPNPQSDLSLAGTVATSECLGDVPWISFKVSMDDPGDVATSGTAVLVMSDGANSVTVPLGELVDDSLSGRVLWPGASIDAAGNPTGWPGWAQQDGAWVETSGNFAWTRGEISAVIVVNPEIGVPLSYPQATPECATGPRGAVAAATEHEAALAMTGTDAAALSIALGAAGTLLAGGVLLLARRRSARR
ncbi:LPXTG cell wall anchor domain-containing protein [Micromonospora sp. DT81.3]|uniref:LPXTG cell wall anchor domain-containing protein n=1 Tax=Actinomycetes TaxID=1760 RepID=UPI003CF24399